MDFSKEMWEKYGHVIASSYRIKAMKSLAHEMKMPSQIAKDTNINPNHISKTLKELKSLELVECVNPKVRIGKLYKLTDKGEEIVKNIK